MSRSGTVREGGLGSWFLRKCRALDGETLELLVEMESAVAVQRKEEAELERRRSEARRGAGIA